MHHLPNNQTVARIVGVSIATVKRAYAELRDKGIIIRIPSYKKDKGKTSPFTYIIGREALCYSKEINIPEPHIDEIRLNTTMMTILDSPMNHEENNSKNLKESLKREAKLPQKKILLREKSNFPLQHFPNSKKRTFQPRCKRYSKRSHEKFRKKLVVRSSCSCEGEFSNIISSN